MFNTYLEFVVLFAHYNVIRLSKANSATCVSVQSRYQSELLCCTCTASEFHDATFITCGETIMGLIMKEFFEHKH